MYERMDKDMIMKRQAMQQIQGARLGDAMEVPRQPEIPRELDALRERADILAEQVGDLLRRLEPITTPPSPEQAGHGGVTKAAFTPIGNSLAAVTERLFQTQTQIMDVLGRLAL